MASSGLMKALVLDNSRREAVVEQLTRPTPGSGEILVHVQSLALNPVDQLYVSSPIATQQKRVVGTDFAGIVVEAGPDIDDSFDPRVKPGTRVSGFLQGACSVNDRPGAFAEYIVVPYCLTWAVPPNLSFEEASTISMCGLTAAQGLYSRLGLPCPFAPDSLVQLNKKVGEPMNIFIYGSSTSVGLYAAQLVHLSADASHTKIRLIGAANATKHDMLREKPYKYDVLVDYTDPYWVQKVKEATGGRGVDFAMDCISEGKTVYLTHDTLGPSANFAVFRGPVGGKYDTSKLQTKPIYGAVWEGLGVEIGYNGTVIPANHDAYDFAKNFFKFLSKPLSTGSAPLEPNPVRVMPGGLERIVPDGFTLLGGGSVTQRKQPARTEDYMRPISAEKLVYNIGEHRLHN